MSDTEKQRNDETPPENDEGIDVVAHETEEEEDPCLWFSGQCAVYYADS
ncbi:hypothetical protein [Planobispora longispora]|uniref:Uncharacterized protein n=1 Tax=Planobispora longispora TaxID=28887 RepID=A0A8J3RVP2_9ACTN|nr:hypothetical protein [Planobispora longispora]BFE80736.1 hypothetical protein GCM10020093_033370 [Planobispora longispora]GIH80787.1 hypothetical protein Plo01_72160 [Planobispora longispora]